MQALWIHPPRNEQQWQAYYDLRYRVLRQPWQQPRGSERDELEEDAIHAALWQGEKLLAVGRAHWLNPSTAQIRYMAVEPAYQGKGHGAAILHYLEAQVKVNGGEWIQLNARESALQFYL
ncbi:MAG: GNAT family N-acetyltransferase, partial [Bacteroidia bacterium]|nr:GNAT family N-acetyltransferase [Bacteroidia bacterium]